MAHAPYAGPAARGVGPSRPAGAAAGRRHPGSRGGAAWLGRGALRRPSPAGSHRTIKGKSCHDSMHSGLSKAGGGREAAGCALAMLCCRAGCLPGLTLPVLLLCLQAAAAAGLAASLLELCVSHHSAVAFQVLRMVRPVPDCRLPGLSSCKALPQARPAKALARALCLPLPPPLLLTTSRPSVHLASLNTYSCIILARLSVAPCRAAPPPPPCLYATTARTAACWTCPPGSSTRAAWWLLQTSAWVRGGAGRNGGVFRALHAAAQAALWPLGQEAPRCLAPP